jgi:hypothetical protein
MANVSGAVQIETGIKHGLSIPFQSVAGEQSIDVGTLLIGHDGSTGNGRFCAKVASPGSLDENLVPGLFWSRGYIDRPRRYR